jgi:hypothetical protein
MNKEKLLNDIENNLDTFRNHFKKIKTEAYKLHPIDIDLLKKKTVDIYDALNAIEGILKEKPETPERKFNLPEIIPKGEITKEAVKREGIEKESFVEEKTEPENEKNEITEEKTDLQTPVEKPQPEKQFVPSATFTPEKEIREEEKEVIEEKSTEQVIEKPSESIKETFQKPDTNFTEKREPIKSTVDLFSDNAAETIGDKLGTRDDSSIADKMQKSQVNDLRQAIGINEKFLFINELFNGDLGRYNKVIDELNELTTPEGIKAYLIELKVANQWPDKNDAYLKLKTLLDRKIN